MSDDLCAVRIEPPRVCSSERGDCGVRYALSPRRTERAEPWYVDIGAPEGATRFSGSALSDEVLQSGQTGARDSAL